MLPYIGQNITGNHGWFATSHARILEHRERRLEVDLCSCTIIKKEN